MELKSLTKEERDYAEELGKKMAMGKIRGIVNLIDGLEKMRSDKDE